MNRTSRKNRRRWLTVNETTQLRYRLDGTTISRYWRDIKGQLRYRQLQYFNYSPVLNKSRNNARPSFLNGRTNENRAIANDIGAAHYSELTQFVIS